MEEITELRTRNSKTFQVDETTRRVVGGSETIHYRDKNGNYKEITANSIDEPEEIRFVERPDNIHIKKEPFCGVLNISNKNKHITVSVSPFVSEINDKIVNEKQSIESASLAETKTKEKVTSGFDFTYDVTKEEIDVGAVFTDIDAVPQTFAFHITTDELDIRESDATHDVYEDGDLISEHPQSIEFVDSNGNVEYEINEPKFVGTDDNWATPIQVKSHTDTSITGIFETPASEWVHNVINETGELVMDPEVSPSYTYVSNGGSISHTPPDTNISIMNEEIQWSGFKNETQDTSQIPLFQDKTFNVGSGSTNSTTQTIYDWDGSLDFMQVETYTKGVSGGDYSATVSHPTMGSATVTHDPTDSTEFIQADFVKESNNNYRGTTLTHEGEVGPDTGALDYTASIFTESTDTTTNTEYTENPTVTINNNEYTYNGTLTQGEESGWIAVDGSFEDGTNSLNFSISGTNDADFKYRYDYDYLPPDAPTNLTASVPDL